MLNAAQIDAVRETFALLSEKKDGFGASLFARLFEHDPTMMAMFAGTDLEKHSRKFMSSLASVVENLEDILPLPKQRATWRPPCRLWRPAGTIRHIRICILGYTGRMAGRRLIRSSSRCLDAHLLAPCK